MKHVVVQSDLHESDIRPANLLSRFREISIEDSHHYFSDQTGLVEVECPACAATDRKFVFDKHSFSYVQCADCGSVYVSPRPARARLEDYYRHSNAVQYRADHLNQATSEARRIHVLCSNVSWMNWLLEESAGAASRRYADRGTNYPVIFDEIKKLDLFDDLYSIGPLEQLAEACRRAGATVTEEPVSDLCALTVFEQLEHQFSPFQYLKSCHEMLGRGGMIFITTRTISGFDLQVLWDKTPYIYVPEHLNLMSIEGINRLLERLEFSVVELSTPGQLDVEFVQHSIELDSSIQLPHFIDYLLSHRDRRVHADFQKFLQKHRLSSHVRVAGLKPSTPERGTAE